MGVTLHIISSGSIGNNYILDCSGEKLILELGLPWKQVLRGLDYKMEDIVGCCVSHIHKDHSFSIPNALSYGLKVFAPPSVCEAYPKCKCVEHMCKYKVGNFTVMPLKVEHNVECFAYIIDHKDMGRLLFYTDTQTFNYYVPDVNYIMGEVNNSDDVILDNLCEGRDVRSQYNNHMSLDTAVDVIRRLYSPKLSKIVCLHLSDNNSGENLIRQRIFYECGLRPYIAESGLVVVLDKYDF